MNIISRALIVLILAYGIAFGQAQTSPGPEPEISGPEVWTIEGTEYQIEGTILVRVDPFPKHLFAIKVIVEGDPGEKDREMAKQIATYALSHGYIEKARNSYKFQGRKIELVPKIGVAVIQQRSLLGIQGSSGYRFQFDISDLQGDRANK